MMMQLSGTEQGAPPKDGSGTALPLRKWEYIEFSFQEFADLQQHGREGWDIFSIIPGSSGYKHAYGKRELRPENHRD